MAHNSLLDSLSTACVRGAEREALTFGNSHFTYRQLWDDVSGLGRAWQRLGIQPGARVVCHLPNRPEYLIALAGAWACGAVHVGVDAESTPTEVERVINLVGADALICEVAPANVPPRVRVCVLGEGKSGAHTFADLLALGKRSAEVAAHAPAANDPAVIFISSGTTGVPKTTVGFHGNLAARWQRLAGWLKFGSGDAHLAPLPLTHGFGLMMTFAALLGGSRVVLRKRFRAAEALDAIAAERITVFNGTPTHFRLLLREQERAPRDIRSLRFSAGTAAAFPPGLVEQILDVLGVELVVMYGSSEGVGVATSDRYDILLGSVGRPQSGAAKIIGPDGETLPAGTVGEIVFSRKVYPVQYWKSGTHAESSEAESWFRSGDLGKLDSEGRLYVFGRLTRLIDRGGMKIDPVEVERALLALPELADAAVVALPNAILGEITCACVVPLGANHPTLDEIRWALGVELASYKLPEELCVLREIPRTSLGKVRADELNALVAEARQQLAVQA